MEREAIIRHASKMKTQKDLLILLNLIKIDELGEKGHPFNMKLLNYNLNPKRNKANYRTFTIPKRSGGVRTISAPQRSLKSLLTYTNRILQAYYEAPECVTGFVPAKSVVDNAERHIGMRYVFNTDISDFFPSISQARVWKTLQTKPFCFPKEIANIIAGLCCSEIDLNGDKRNALPQGSPCSPILTNIVCHNLDRKLCGVARRFHLRYSRYADDITFSGNENIFSEDGAFFKELSRIISAEGFSMNTKKTRLQKRGERQEVTGLVVSEHRTNVTREYIRDLDNLLYIWERYGINTAFAKFVSRYQPKQDLCSHTPKMANVIQGRLQYLKMVRGEADPVWRRLQKRFNLLTNKPAKHSGTDIEYLHSYTIATFESLTGAKINFNYTDGCLHPLMDLNGVSTPISISRYASTRIRHILDSGDPKKLEFFRKKFHIALCHTAGTPSSFNTWFIFRNPPKSKEEPLDQLTKDVLHVGIDSAASVAGETDMSEPRLNTDEILNTLIESNFDLNTLDQWDKIKSS